MLVRVKPKGEQQTCAWGRAQPASWPDRMPAAVGVVDPGDGSALDRELGLGTRASAARGIRVARELDKLARGQLQDLLEGLADVGEHLLALLRDRKSVV